MSMDMQLTRCVLLCGPEVSHIVAAGAVAIEVE